MNWNSHVCVAHMCAVCVRMSNRPILFPLLASIIRWRKKKFNISCVCFPESHNRICFMSVANSLHRPVCQLLRWCTNLHSVMNLSISRLRYFLLMNMNKKEHLNLDAEATSNADISLKKVLSQFGKRPQQWSAHKVLSYIPTQECCGAGPNAALLVFLIRGTAVCCTLCFSAGALRGNDTCLAAHKDT